MQWLSSTKFHIKILPILYTSVANKALPLLAIKASGLANTTEYWPLATAVLVAGGVSFSQASSLDSSSRQGIKLIFHQSWKRWYHNCNTWWWTCLNLAKKVPTERISLENNRFPKSGWQIHKYILPTIARCTRCPLSPSTEHCPAERSTSLCTSDYLPMHESYQRVDLFSTKIFTP